MRRLELEGDLEGFRRSELVLRTVAIDGLELHLDFRPDGSDNLPRPRRGGAASRQLALRIDGLSISDSAVTVAERRATVDVRARAVAARLAGLGRTDLVGSVAAQEVELGLPKAAPVGLALAARGPAARRPAGDRDGARQRAGLRGAGERPGGLRRHATRIELAGQVESRARSLDRLGYLHGEIAGRSRFDGGFEWRRELGRPRRRHLARRSICSASRSPSSRARVDGEGRTIRFDLARGRFAGGGLAGPFGVDSSGRYPAGSTWRRGRRARRVLAHFAVPIAGLAGGVSGRSATSST